MGSKEGDKVVSPHRRANNRTIETSGPLGRSEHIPECNAIRRQDFHSLRVYQGWFDVEDARDQFPEGVLRMRVVLLHLE